MGDSYRTIRVAAVQAAPVFLDRERTVAKACGLIREAGASGAHLIGFPEGYIPTHPLWYHFHVATSVKAMQFSRELFCNSVEIPGPATEELCRAAREARIYVVMGLCEKTPGRMGTLYNTLLFIDDHGNVLGRHRKLHPTLGERLVHAPGDSAGLRAFPTEFGAVSGLMCGENSNALSIFSLDAQGTTVHVASWPAHFPLTTNMAEIIELASKSLAYQTKSFVVNSVGAIDDRMRELLPVTDEDRSFLSRQQGAASIVSPRGKIVAGPMAPGEGILYADINISDIIIPKITQDFSGHYNRFDVFSVNVNLGANPPVRHLPSSSPDGSANAALEEPQRARELTNDAVPRLGSE